MKRATTVQQYLTQHNLLNSVQSGFKKYYSTQTAVAFFSDSTWKNTEVGQMTGTLFIDLRKTFDIVPHHALIWKLIRFGIKEKLPAFDVIDKVQLNINTSDTRYISQY